jgi:ADP-heptose:LPS heptosyltransferase
MKITISSPDGLGDFVLRNILFRTLLDEGHDLQIFMRPPAADLARHVLPGPDIQVIWRDPYSRIIRTKIHPFRAEHRVIHRFRPDLFVAAPFSLNFFDQLWIERGGNGARIAGFSTDESFRASETTCDPADLARRFDIAVPVQSHFPELEKNRLLAAAIVGHEVPPRRPVLNPSSGALAEAGLLMEKHGLEPGKFWVTCVGARRGVVMKDWGEQNWVTFFRETACAEPLVFLGNAAESQSIERICEQLPAGRHYVNLCQNPPPISVSFALSSLSSGYVGRDSGIMHLSAAAGKPVLAIFAGGHWGRFLPVADMGVVVTQVWPCRGCNFECAHEDASCISRVPLEPMLEGWRLLQTGSLRSLRIIEVPMDEQLLPEIAQKISRSYACLAHECRRQSQYEQRPLNVLDAVGLFLRSLARRSRKSLKSS